jgi:hypothetical protein
MPTAFAMPMSNFPTARKLNSSPRHTPLMRSPRNIAQSWDKARDRSISVFTRQTRRRLSPVQAIGIAAVKDGGLLGFSPQSPLHPWFFGMRNKSPTDRPEHFAHPNTALRLSGLWVRDSAAGRHLLTGLNVTLRRKPTCGPIHGGATVASLPEGEIDLVEPQPGTGDVAGVRIEVRSLAMLTGLLKKNSVPARTYRACSQASVWISPAAAHGIWLQFVEAR